jgi:hypothetical protein
MDEKSRRREYPTGFSRVAMAVVYSSAGVASELLLSTDGASCATEALR